MCRELTEKYFRNWNLFPNMWQKRKILWARKTSKLPRNVFVLRFSRFAYPCNFINIPTFCSGGRPLCLLFGKTPLHFPPPMSRSYHFFAILLMLEFFRRIRKQVIRSLSRLNQRCSFRPIRFAWRIFNPGFSPAIFDVYNTTCLRFVLVEHVLGLVVWLSVLSYRSKTFSGAVTLNHLTYECKSCRGVSGGPIPRLTTIVGAGLLITGQ